MRVLTFLFCCLIFAKSFANDPDPEEETEDESKQEPRTLECPASLLPNAEPKSPCICLQGDDDAILIECKQLTSPRILKQIMMKLGEKRIDALEIKESTLASLPKKLTGGNAIETLFMRNNSISAVDPTAFSGSEGLTQRIDLSSNDIKEFKFEMFNQFTELSVLNLGENKITKITSAGNIPSLQVLYLYMNKIDTISPGAFNLLEKLEYLDLRWNNLKQLATGALTVPSPRWQLRIRNNQLETLEGAFRGGVTPFLVELSHNNVSTLKEEVYGPVLEAAYTEGSQLYLDGNRLTCDCDIAWVVTNSTIIRFVDNAICNENSTHAGKNLQDLLPESFETCQGFEPTAEPV